MIRPISRVRKQVRTLMAIVLLAGWPAVAGAEELGNTALVLHPDAYWYDNEGHASSSGQTTTTPGRVQARGQVTETWDTTMVLHPDAYWYNGESHPPRTPEASTPAVQLASPAR